MSRISRHQMFMQMAHVASLRSTCYRGNVGAVLVRDNNILSIGYNGPAAGERHCTGGLCERLANGGCARSLHAETNAINRAHDLHASRSIVELYVTDSPCLKCAELISFQLNIRRVFYSRKYRINDAPFAELNKHGIEIFQVTPAGHVISQDGELIEE